jgi:dihydropteroate synthase
MGSKDTLFSVKQTVNCAGKMLDFRLTRIMGILNITPDSFYDGGKYHDETEILEHTNHMLEDGADIIDIGGYSSRPGANDISSSEEKIRLTSALKIIRRNFPSVILSVDTFRSEIAEYVIKEFGVNIINDISAGLMDERMFEIVGSFKVPYIMMHMRGTPLNMQNNPQYTDIIKDLLDFFVKRIAKAKNSGIEDIIIDPGFGFGKSLNDNYQLLRELRLFEILGFPIMVGVSRKSMIYKSLNLNPAEALNGTTVLNALAVNNGAKLLRVHDVKEAVQTVKLLSIYCDSGD